MSREMARYNITGINYAALGEHRSFINLDLELDYELYDLVHLLCAETGTSGYASLGAKSAGDLSALSVDIGTEHGEGFWHKT